MSAVTDKIRQFLEQPPPDIGAVPGKVVSFAKEAYESTVPRPAKEYVFNPVGTAIGKAFDVATAPGRAIAGGVGAVGEGENPVRAAIESALHRPGSREWEDVMRQGVERTFQYPPYLADESPEDYQKRVEGIKSSIAGAQAVLPEFVYDPVNVAAPLGVTKLGRAALKEGLLESNLGRAAKAGQRSLLALEGGTPLIEGKPVMGAFGKVQETARKLFPGAYTDTGNLKFDTDFMENLVNKQNLAEIQAGPIKQSIQSAIMRHSALRGVPEGDIQKKLAEYIEPTGSQVMPPPSEMSPHRARRYEKLIGGLDREIEKQIAETEKMRRGFVLEEPDIEKRLQELRDLQVRRAGVASKAQEEELAVKSAYQKHMDPLEEIRANVGKELHPELKDIADEFRSANRAFFESEAPIKKYGFREFYLPHIRTPEYEKFLEKTFGKAGIPASARKSPTSTSNVFGKKRDIEDMTVNEVNNLSAEGRLDEVLGFPEAKNFTGKVFSDDIGALSAARYLKNQKIVTADDFMKHAQKTYGMSPEAFHKARNAGEIGAKDYVKVTHPSGDAYYPSEIGNFLNAKQLLQNGDPIFSSAVMNGWANTMRFMKSAGYGLYPKAVMDNLIGGPFLGLANGMYNPFSHLRGASLAKKIRMANDFSDKPILYSPKYGPVTDRELVEQSKRHRGHGLGLARADIMGDVNENIFYKNPIGKVMIGGQDFSEDANRLGSMINLLEKGYSWEGAAKAVRKAYYDYSDMSRLDKKISATVPWYIFARKNIPRMTRLLVTNPKFMVNTEKIRAEFNEGEDDALKFSPEWRLDQLPTYVGNDSKGQPMFAFAGRYLPYAAINQILSTDPKTMLTKPMEYMASMQSPFIKTPIELAMNKSLFLHKPISRTEGQTSVLYPGMSPVGSKITYAIQNLFPPARGVQNLLSERRDIPQKLLKAATGLNIQSVNPEEEKTFYIRKIKTELSGMKNDIKMFARQEYLFRQKGETASAENAKRNKERAVLNYQKKAQEAMKILGSIQE